MYDINYMSTKTLSLNKTELLTVRNLIYATAIAIPMISHGPQLIIGSAVNLILFLSATKLETKEFKLLAILPSLSAIANGVLFGSFTMLLVFLAPMIWVSNYSLMVAFSKLQKQKIPVAASVIISSIIKASFIFIFAFSLVSLGVLPKLFLTAMGTTQLTTALIGGFSAVLIDKYVISKKLAKDEEDGGEKGKSKK